MLHSLFVYKFVGICIETRYEVSLETKTTAWSFCIKGYDAYD